MNKWIIFIPMAILLIGCKTHSMKDYHDAAYRVMQHKPIEEISDSQRVGAIKHLSSCVNHVDKLPVQIKINCVFVQALLQSKSSKNAGGPNMTLEAAWANLAIERINISCSTKQNIENITCLSAIAALMSLEAEKHPQRFTNQFSLAIEKVKECARSGELYCIDALILVRTQSLKNFNEHGNESLRLIDACTDLKDGVSTQCLFNYAAATAADGAAISLIEDTALYGLALLEECANSGNSICMSRWAWVIYSRTCESQSPEIDALKWFTLAARYGDKLAQSYLIRLNQPVPTPDLMITNTSGSKIQFRANSRIKPQVNCTTIKKDFIKEVII